MANLTKEQEKLRNKCIIALNALEKKYGARIFRTACNRKLTVDRQIELQKKEMQKAEKNLEQLKKGKPLPYY